MKKCYYCGTLHEYSEAECNERGVLDPAGQCDDHTKEFTCYLCHTPSARKFPVKA